MSDPLTLGAMLDAAWREHLRAGRRSGAMTRSHVWASGRRECVRRMALDLIHPEDQEAFSDDTLERFERGNEREAAVTARLMQIGPRAPEPFVVIEGQRRFEIKDRDGVLLITGKIDGRLSFKGRKDRPVFEVKSGASVANVETLEDLGRSQWTRHYPDQLLAYLLAESEPVGVLILDRPGMPAFIEIRLEEHLQRAEGFLRDARTAIDAKLGAGPLPAYAENQALCRACPHFGKSCAPPVDFGDGLRVITDETLIEAAEIVAKHGEAAKSHARAEKKLKEALRGIPQALVGPLLANGKPRATSKLELPDELRKQYTTTDPEGAWVVSLEPHGIKD